MNLKPFGIVYFILFLTLFISCKKEIKTEDYEKSIFKIIGGSADDYIYYTLEQKDGGWLLFGETKSKGHGGKDIWVVRVDEQMNIIWEQTHGGIFDESFGNAPNLSHPFIDKDGNILISGVAFKTINGGVKSTGFIFKFNPEGKLINEAFLPITFDFYFFANYDIDQLPNGNYTVYGYTYPVAHEYYLAELNSDLGLTSNFIQDYSTITFPGRLFGNTIKSFEVVNDSTMKLISGTLSTDTLISMEQNYKVDIEKTGSLLESNNFYKSSNLLKFPDGSAIALIYQNKNKIAVAPFDYVSDHNLYMLKFDINNHLIWQTKTTGGGIINEKIAICKDGSFLSFYKDKITKYSAFGSILWATIVPNGNNSITSISISADESILVSSISVIDRKFSADVLLFRLNANGELITK